MNAIPGDCGSEQSGQPSGARGTAEVASGPEGGNPGRIYVEDWTAAFGTPYMIADDAERAETSEVAEDGGSFTFHAGHPSEPGDLQLAFVDGVRRGDVSLYQEDSDSGAIARGVAATHACGAVLCEEGSRPGIADVRVTRLVIWGSGVTGELPPVAGGWSWKSESVATTAPDAPVRTLQTRMRQNEARLTEDLAQAGWHVVLDGPLHFVRYHHLPVCGYVKTHARPYLPAELHRQVRQLRGGERTSLFVLRGKDPGTQLYSCYLRLKDAAGDSGPWYGIVRLEFPVSAGLAAVTTEATRLAGLLPVYASLPHTDPRAPQNLQPIGALERELRHRLGDARLAVRAVRASVASLRLPSVA